MTRPYLYIICFLVRSKLFISFFGIYSRFFLSLLIFLARQLYIFFASFFISSCALYTGLKFSIFLCIQKTQNTLSFFSFKYVAISAFFFLHQFTNFSIAYFFFFSSFFTDLIAYNIFFISYIPSTVIPLYTLFYFSGCLLLLLIFFMKFQKTFFHS